MANPVKDLVQDQNLFTFSLIGKKAEQHLVKITVPNKQVNTVYNEVLLTQKQTVNITGLPKGYSSLHYIENNYKVNILQHLKELFFTHCIMNFLCKSLVDNKIVIVGDPKLVDIEIEPNKEAEFLFGLWRVNNESNEKWKKINFIAPGRKKYKDLDKQVELFIKEESDNEAATQNLINVGDWICFEMQIIDNDQKPLIDGYKDELWLKRGNEEADREYRLLFIGKKIGDSFVTKDSILQEYISNDSDIKYNFLITVKNHISDQYFSLNNFKKYFGLKTAKDLHLKLIEVFSYRNDLSQRRETVETILKALLKQYFISIPSHLLEHQRQLVLKAVHDNPDYNVYKAQSDFKEKIKMLAEKQLKETIIMDSIAYEENVKVSDKDVEGYLNLMNRARTREFIYFKIPSTKNNGQEIPIPTEMLKQYCLREKTLNFVINYLIKK